MSAAAVLTARPRWAEKKLFSRNAVIAAVVVALHLAAVWALENGLRLSEPATHPTRSVVLAQISAQFIKPLDKTKRLTPPAANVQAAHAPATHTTPVVKAAAKTAINPSAPLATPPPQLLAPKADPTPALVNMPQGSTAPAVPAALTLQTATTTATTTANLTVAHTLSATAGSHAAGASNVQLPSSHADYLQNPLPPYPPISRRFNEQGKTVVRVLIGLDGTPQEPEIIKSSGFERLDQAAVATVMRWRYVPGKRGATPEAMRFNVPIQWVLE